MPVSRSVEPRPPAATTCPTVSAGSSTTSDDTTAARYLAPSTAGRGIGFRSRLVTVPSRSSEPRLEAAKVRATTGRSTGRTSWRNSSRVKVAGSTSAPAANTSGSATSRAMMTSRRPARSWPRLKVSSLRVLLIGAPPWKSFPTHRGTPSGFPGPLRPNPSGSSASHQVAEDLLQGLVGGADLAEAGPLVAGQAGQGGGEAVDRAGPGPQGVAVDLDRDRGGQGDQPGGQAAGGGGLNHDRARLVGHQVADGVVVAGGGQPPRDQHQDLGGEPLHLPEDVAGHQHRDPGGRDHADQLHEPGPLARVHAGHGLVQDQQGRLVDDRPGHLGPLALALG